MKKELKNDKLTFKEAFDKDEYKDALKENSIENLGYFIEPNDLFSKLVSDAKVEDEDLVNNVNSALKKVSDSALGQESAQDFEGLFEDVDLTSTK